MQHEAILVVAPTGHSINSSYYPKPLEATSLYTEHDRKKFDDLPFEYSNKPRKHIEPSIAKKHTRM
jgi:hypothetical protein